MICCRCKNEIDDYVPYKNTECYGGPNYWACPICGKLYKFSQKIVISSVDDYDYYSRREEDDWGKKIVKDKDYVDCSR